MPAKAGIQSYLFLSLRAERKTRMAGTSQAMTTSLESAVDGGLQPRLRRRHAFLKGLDVVAVLERHADVVEPFQEPRAVGGRDVELYVRSAWAADGLGLEIDRERRRAVRFDHAFLERFRVGRRERHRQEAVLQAVLAIEVGEATRHDRADIVGEHAPHSSLARGAGAEIVASHQNPGIAELRLVEDEVGILAAVVALARAHEQYGLVVRLERAERLHRRDLVGVDVILEQRDRDASVLGERLHQAAPRLRTSAMRPAIALAAAVAGLARCVRVFGPCRFSKLRLVVETMRSPGSPRSPLPPAHIEHPDSPQAKPASRNTLSRPFASAARFTLDEPGTTMAKTPFATCRPRTTSAAASRSGSRALVQEPMNTRLIARPTSGAPGLRSMYLSALSM